MEFNEAWRGMKWWNEIKSGSARSGWNIKCELPPAQLLPIAPDAPSTMASYGWRQQRWLYDDYGDNDDDNAAWNILIMWLKTNWQAMLKEWNKCTILVDNHLLERVRINVIFSDILLCNHILKWDRPADLLVPNTPVLDVLRGPQAEVFYLSPESCWKLKRTECLQSGCWHSGTISPRKSGRQAQDIFKSLLQTLLSECLS